MVLKSILEVLAAGASFLERKGVESARLNMEHLLAHALGLKRMDLYLQFDRPLSEAELGPLREWTMRRAAGEPLQHLLGTVDFHRFTFRCDARALIPRPETEELVDKILARRKGRPTRRILDMGCGSGVIGLSLAAAIPDAQVLLADASADALALARENAALLARQVAAQLAARTRQPVYVPLGADSRLAESPGPGADDVGRSTAAPAPAPVSSGVGADAGAMEADSGFLPRVRFAQSDLFSAIDFEAPERSFDVLAANLPYIPTGEIASLSPEVRNDPAQALDGGESGLEIIGRFIADAKRFCAPGALVALEHGPDQGEAVAALLARAGFEQVAVEHDMSRRARFAFGIAR